MQKQRIHKLLYTFNVIQKEAQLPPWQKTTTQEPSPPSTLMVLVPASSAVQNINHVNNMAIQGVFAVTNVFFCVSQHSEGSQPHHL